jgi:DNA-binding HxlR family transcriptional regulator
VLHEAKIDAKQLGQALSPRPRRAWTPLARAVAATGDHWTLMIALTLAPGRMRVTYLQRRLPGVSAGVLERYLAQMITLGLVTRTRFKEMPPRVELELTDAGRELLPVASALTRWGAHHLWSAPREHERVDLEALLHLLPMLLEESTGLPTGSVEAIVEDSDPPVRRLYRVQDGRLRMDDGAEDLASAPEGSSATRPRSAALHGDTNAWIAALGPGSDYAHLRVTGDKRLAKRILDALGGQLRQGLPQWPRDRRR